LRISALEPGALTHLLTDASVVFREIPEHSCVTVPG
jgi:hypothetical protein